MRGNISHLAGPLVVLAAVAGSAPGAFAEPITYQGRLTDTSMPATGSYDMIFRIYDAPTGGTLLATAPMVTVSTLDGLILATPDFPVGTFTGATVYLDVSVRHTGATLYSRLTPRQQVTPAPLSMRSLNERWSPLGTTRIQTDSGINGVVINDTAPTFGDAALMVTSATTAGALGGMYVNTPVADGVPYYGWSANRVSLAEARVDGATNTFVLRSATTEWLRVSPEGRVGIGTSPTATERLRVNGNIVSLGQVVADDLVAGDDLIATDTSYANTFEYSSAKTRYLSIAPEAFHPAYTAQDGIFGGGTGYAYLNDSVGAGAITTGVCLPDGATVTGFDVFVVDESATANLSISLTRRGNTSNAYSTMAEVDSAGSSTSVVTLTDNTVAMSVIDTEAFNYLVWVYCEDWQAYSTRLKGVRIRYTVSGPD